MTVAFDAGGQRGNFAHLAGAGLHQVGSRRLASDCPDLTAPARPRPVKSVGEDRTGGLTAITPAARPSLPRATPGDLDPVPGGCTPPRPAAGGTTLAKAGRNSTSWLPLLARGAGPPRSQQDKVGAGR